MAKRILDNFDYRTSQPLDARQIYADIAALKAASNKASRLGLYDGLIAWVTSEQNYYVFHSENEGTESATGKWRLLDKPLTEEEIGEIVK